MNTILKIIAIGTIVLIAYAMLTSCNRYTSPYPDYYPCEKQHRPNIFRH